MKVDLAYGKTGLEIQVPDSSVVIEPHYVSGLKNEQEYVKQALQNPIGTQALSKMVKPTDQVAIVISDITRPTPNEKLVPWLIEELPHVPLENFVIINGTGTHRDQTQEEFIAML